MLLQKHTRNNNYLFLEEIVRVRRKCYPPSSPAGKGAKWECAGTDHTEWHAFDMDIQCLIEEAWARVSNTYTFIYNYSILKLNRK